MGRPVCVMCKRTIAVSDRVRRNAEGLLVHAEGACRGPLAKHWFVVGYCGEAPRFVGRLPSEKAELEDLLAELDQSLDLRLLRLNQAQLGRILRRMGA